MVLEDYKGVSVGLEEYGFVCFKYEEFFFWWVWGEGLESRWVGDV